MIDNDTTEFENEGRAVTKLCKPPTHENILSVLQHGYLQNKSHCFFDMELRQLNLHDYIQSEWNPTLTEQLKDLTIEKAL